MLSSRKPLALVFIASGLVVFLLASFHIPTPIPQERPPRQVNPQRTLPLDSADTRQKMEPVRFQDTDFCRTILDNNLFRPLGWTPPRPVSPYRLLGTLVSGATDAVWVSKAIITVGGEVRVVEIGDSLDAETKVLGIDRRSVLLETAGKEQILTLPTGDVLLRGR